MTEIPREQGASLAPFFSWTEETMVLSYTAGWMGRGWVDDTQSPRCARIVVGDIGFLGGDTGGPQAAEMAGTVPSGHTTPYYMLVPENEAWGRLVEQGFGEGCRKATRYAFRKDTVFDRQHLAALAAAVPVGYTLHSVDKALYETLVAQPLLADVCGKFEDWANFAARGMGVCALKDGVPVAGAGSYTAYPGGIEIEVDTLAEHRRQHLATACSARLILDCLERGLYPSWDAANLSSVGLAEKLGYVRSHDYIAYMMKVGAE